MLQINCIKHIFGYLYFPLLTFHKIKPKLGGQLEMCLSVYCFALKIKMQSYVWICINTKSGSFRLRDRKDFLQVLYTDCYGCMLKEAILSIT